MGIKKLQCCLEFLNLLSLEICLKYVITPGFANQVTKVIEKIKEKFKADYICKRTPMGKCGYDHMI